MINQVTLVGRLTKDLEIRKTNSNKSVLGFTLAVDRRFKQEGQPTADFINCIAWNQSADFLAKYASKGDLVGVSGRITTRNYEGQNGKVFITEVTAEEVSLLGSKKTTATNVEETPTEEKLEQIFGKDKVVIESDELPFY